MEYEVRGEEIEFEVEELAEEEDEFGEDLMPVGEENHQNGQLFHGTCTKIPSRIFFLEFLLFHVLFVES